MEGNGVDGQYVVVAPIGPSGSPSGVAYGETEWVKKTEWSSYYRDSHNNYESEEGGDHTETFNPNTGAIDTQSGSHSQWSQGGGSGSGSGSGSATGSSSSSTWGSAGTIGVGAGFAVAAATPAPAPTPTLGGGAAALQSQGLTGAANLVTGAGTTTAQGAGSSTFVWNESSGSLPNGGRWEYYDDGVNWWYYEYDDQNNMTLEKSGTYTSTMQSAFFRSAAAYYAQNPEEYARLLRRSDRNKVKQAFYDMTRPDGAGGGLGSSSSSGGEAIPEPQPITPLNAFVAFWQMVTGTFQVSIQEPGGGTDTAMQAGHHTLSQLARQTLGQSSESSLDNPPEEIRSGNWNDDEIVYWRREDGTVHAYYDPGSWWGQPIYLGELKTRNGEPYIVRNGRWSKLEKVQAEVDSWGSAGTAKEWDDWFVIRGQPGFTQDKAQGARARNRAIASDAKVTLEEVTPGQTLVLEFISGMVGAGEFIDTLGMGLLGEFKMSLIPWGTGVKIVAKGAKLLFKFTKVVGGKVVHWLVELGDDKLDDLAAALGKPAGTSADDLAKELKALEARAAAGDTGARAVLASLDDAVIVGSSASKQVYNSIRASVKTRNLLNELVQRLHPRSSRKEGLAHVDACVLPLAGAIRRGVQDG